MSHVDREWGVWRVEVMSTFSYDTPIQKNQKLESRSQALPTPGSKLLLLILGSWSPLGDHQSLLRERSLCPVGPPNVIDDPDFLDLSNRMAKGCLRGNCMNLSWGWLKSAVD